MTEPTPTHMLVVKPVAVRQQMRDVIGGRVALKYRHDRKRQAEGEQRVIALDGEALVLRDREAGAREHEGLAHVVLGDCGRDPDDTGFVEAPSSSAA